MPAFARKRWGQHWLRDPRALEQIAAAAELSGRDTVLEIGPGTGALTQYLLARAGFVVAVEIDRERCQQLARTLSAWRNWVLLPGDIRTLDLPAELAERGLARPNKVAANIPYNITSPILQALLGRIAQPAAAYETVVLLVQQVIAERLCARPGSRTYGALSVRIQYLAECESIGRVPARAFSPAPQVDSAIVRLRPRPFEPQPRDPARLEQAITLGFANRRKMLRNNLKPLTATQAPARVLARSGIDPQARAEALSVRDWIALSDRLDALAANRAASS